MGSCRERDAIAGPLGSDQATWFGDGDFGIVDGHSVDASGDDVLEGEPEANPALTKLSSTLIEALGHIRIAADFEFPNPAGSYLKVL